MFKIINGTPWILVCTDKFEETVRHFREVMGMSISAEGKPTVDTQFNSYAQFSLPGGPIIEVVEPREHLRELYRGMIESYASD